MSQNVTIIVTTVKRTMLNGTNEIDEVVSDYAKILFEPCMPFEPTIKFAHSNFEPGQGNWEFLLYESRISIDLEHHQTCTF